MLAFTLLFDVVIFFVEILELLLCFAPLLLVLDFWAPDLVDLLLTLIDAFEGEDVAERISALSFVLAFFKSKLFF